MHYLYPYDTVIVYRFHLLNAYSSFKKNIFNEWDELISSYHALMHFQVNIISLKLVLIQVKCVFKYRSTYFS